MPPAPEFLFRPPASYGPFTWTEATGADRYRRAMYTFRRRSTPYPMLANFDVPNADTSCVRGLRSNTPLQALTTLNETLFVESAQALARRMLAEGGKSDAERLAYGFRLCTSRTPTDEERGELACTCWRQQASESPKAGSAPGRSPPARKRSPPRCPRAQRRRDSAAYTVVAVCC